MAHKRAAKTIVIEDFPCSEIGLGYSEQDIVKRIKIDSPELPGYVDFLVNGTIGFQDNRHTQLAVFDAARQLWWASEQGVDLLGDISDAIVTVITQERLLARRTESETAVLLRLAENERDGFREQTAQLRQDLTKAKTGEREAKRELKKLKEEIVDLKKADGIVELEFHRCSCKECTG
jgi:hypothetical protein